MVPFNPPGAWTFLRRTNLTVPPNVCVCLFHQRANRSLCHLVSTITVGYLDSALQSGDRGQALHVFRLFSVCQYVSSNGYYMLIFPVTQQCLNLFLELRCESRLVQPMESGFCFTWIDDILSKLGTLVLSVTNDDHQGGQMHHDTLINQMEHDAVRAASQIPGKLIFFFVPNA